MRLPALSFVLVGLASAIPLEVAERTNNHGHSKNLNIQVGNRPEFLIENMDAGPLKDKLASCSEGPFKKSSSVIGHRGAPLQFPEHSKQSYMAAARQGAGTVECDVTFTKDKQLVCRHSQCDLHTTTDILQYPALAAKCTKPFTPAVNGTGATAACCTSDITLAEFQTLCAKMDGTPNPAATTVADFLKTPPFRTDLYATCAKLMTHVDSIKLIDSYGLDFTPEIKTPVVPMPYENWTQNQYVQAVIDDYKSLGIHPDRVWAQSFLPADIYYLIKNEPKFGKQAVYLDERVDTVEGYNTAVASLPQLAKDGVKIMAPAFFALTKVDSKGKIVPSEYAIAAKKAGLKIIAWSFERSGFLNKGGDYYYQYVKADINNDGDMYTVLDVLFKDVGILKVFSDWPATVTYYANCMGLK